MDADTLAEIGVLFRWRIRDEADPEANLRWLRDQLGTDQQAPVSEAERLLFVLGAAVPTTDWLRLTQWTRPTSDPNDIDEIAVERACHGDRVTLTRAERRAAVHRLTKRGLSGPQIAERLGMEVRLVTRDRRAKRAA